MMTKTWGRSGMGPKRTLKPRGAKRSAERRRLMMLGAEALAAVELGWRGGQRVRLDARIIRGPGDIAEILRTLIGDEPRETFVAIGLDARLRIRMFRTVAVGGVASVDVHMRDVFAPFMGAGIHAVIVAHNHPSGVAEPSDADRLLSLRMAEVGRLLGMLVLDHLIITRTAAVSLPELGMLDPPLG